MTETNADGNIVLSSLPQPQRDMVLGQIGGQGLLVLWDATDGYCADFESLLMLLAAAGQQCGSALGH